MVLIMSRIASSSAADKAALTGGASKAQGAAADRETLCGPDPGPQSIGLLGGKDRGVKPQAVRRLRGAQGGSLVERPSRETSAGGTLGAADGGQSVQRGDLA